MFWAVGDARTLCACEDPALALAAQDFTLTKRSSRPIRRFEVIVQTLSYAPASAPPKIEIPASARKPWALSQLPAFPPVASRLLSLLSKSDVGFREITALILSDPAIAAEVLRMANSPLFAAKNSIGNVLQAVALLGSDRVKGIACTVAIKNYMRNALKSPMLSRCWSHSLATAVITSEIGQISMLDAGACYTAGLLHDIGRLMLIAAYPKPYTNLLAVCTDFSLPLLQAERDIFDIDHCEAGLAMASEWNLPAELRVSIADHHRPFGGGVLDVKGAVHFACRLADSTGFGASAIKSQPPDEVVAELPEWERERLKPNWEQFKQLIASRIASLSG